MTVLKLTMTTLRTGGQRSDVGRALLCGRGPQALANGRSAWQRLQSHTGPEAVATGTMLAALHLLCGRIEEAEEVQQQLLKVYDALPRIQVRWLVALDRGAMYLALDRPGRCINALASLADAPTAPPEYRIEALAMVAESFALLGEYRRAQQVLHCAAALAEPLADPRWSSLVEMASLECEVRGFWLRRSEALDLLGHGVAEQSASGSWDSHIQSLQPQLDSFPLLQARLRFVAGALACRDDGAAALAAACDHLRWLRQQQLGLAEDLARVEAANALLLQRQVMPGESLLRDARSADLGVEHRAYQRILKACKARLHAAGGRHLDALSLSAELSREALASLRAELAQVPTLRILETGEWSATPDTAQLQLPLRYRKAYRYILDHLRDADLSVQRVAQFLGVTERALQLAFRHHLGLSPAEFIRCRRVEQIRAELHRDMSDEGIAEVAARWGIRSRSTLVQNFRQVLGETPTLRGGAAQHPLLKVA